MEVVLLERIEKLGQMGDIVHVKDGFARNFLLPQQKALRATQKNIAFFEAQRANYEARNLEQRKDAETVAQRMEGTRIMLVRQASEADQLYGSVTTRDIASALSDEEGFSVDHQQVVLDRPIKTVGLADVRIRLHPEVYVTISVNVARTAEEAEAQVIASEAELRAEAEEFFESEELAQHAVEDLIDSEESEQDAEPVADETPADESAGDDEADKA